VRVAVELLSNRIRTKQGSNEVNKVAVDGRRSEAGVAQLGRAALKVSALAKGRAPRGVSGVRGLEKRRVPGGAGARGSSSTRKGLELSHGSAKAPERESQGRQVATLVAASAVKVREPAATAHVLHEEAKGNSEVTVATHGGRGAGRRAARLVAVTLGRQLIIIRI
jgi:hypothetical protein